MACDAGHNVVVQFTRDSKSMRRRVGNVCFRLIVFVVVRVVLSSKQVDVSEAVDVFGLNKKLEVICTNTQVIHMACLARLMKGAGRSSTYKACNSGCLTKVPFQPPDRKMLMLLHPNPDITWLASGGCHTFDRSKAYNAVHFNIDVDWILYRCEGLKKWVAWKKSTRMKHHQKNAEHTQKEIEEKCCTRIGSYVPFIRKAMNEYIKVMAKQFSDPALPLVVATSIGKMTNSTSWIFDEFRELVKKELKVKKVVVGSSGTDFREINAAADIGVMLKAQDVVLTSDSTFSFFVQAHFEDDGKKVGYANPGGCP
jgi:hypothetical protein